MKVVLLMLQGEQYLYRVSLQNVHDYKTGVKTRFLVKGEGSLALAAIQDNSPGTCQSLSNHEKHCLLKAAVAVSDGIVW